MLMTMQMPKNKMASRIATVKMAMSMPVVNSDSQSRAVEKDLVKLLVRKNSIYMHYTEHLHYKFMCTCLISSEH